MPMEYKSAEYLLHENLVQIQEMLTLLGYDKALLDRTAQCKALLKDKTYRVAVMGEFKRGKSSLINTLLGTKILPADATPTTATVNRITFGAEPGVVVEDRDGGRTSIGIDELGDYVTKLTSDGAARAANIKEATVYYPAVLCQNHVDIIDTPGLNDDERMTRITIELVERVDAVIVPIHARAPFSETEKKFVCQLLESENIGALFFVVTFLDQLDEDDYEYGDLMEKIGRRIRTNVLEELERRGDPDVLNRAREMLNSAPICGLSSSQALNAFLTNNRKLLAESRFEEFQTKLLQVVTAKQVENAVNRTVAHIRSVVEAMEEEDSKKRLAWEETERRTALRWDAALGQLTGARAFLDRRFAEEYDRMDALIREGNALKNQLAQDLRAALTGQVAIHSADFARLTEAGRVRADEVFTARFRREAQRCFTAISDELSRRNQDVMSGLPDGPEQRPEPEGGAERMRFLSNLLNNVSFDWGRSFSSAHQNPAEVVLSGIDTAVRDYMAVLHGALTALRGNWFQQAAREEENLRAWVRQAAERQLEALRQEVQAYDRNYRVLSETAQTVLSRSKTLWGEYKGQED